LALVRAAEAKFTKQLEIANGKLKEAEDLLATAGLVPPLRFESKNQKAGKLRNIG
jgi:hypothetical protein